MSEAHTSQKEMNNLYKNNSLKTWRDANVSEHALRHILHVPLNKESCHAEPVNEFTFTALSHKEPLQTPIANRAWGNKPCLERE